jgi:stage III sporulation protein AG
MLRYNQYIDNVKDKAWFDSSNVVYGECDESDTQYKTVRIVFKNGSTYQPVVVTQFLPQITGVLVVANGVSNLQIKNNLINAISSVYNLNISCIDILEGK